MKILQEFKSFAMRGNVVDLAVGVIIGTAFGKIVTSLVADVVMPPIGLLLGGVDFSELAITLKEAVGDTPAVTINIGLFINTLIDFMIVAFVIFMVIKQLNRFRYVAPAERQRSVLIRSKPCGQLLHPILPRPITI